jgi:FkbM family methyltransferase
VIVNTRRLFARLLSTMDIGAICDVGSMNGADALVFSAAAPGSSVYAFEPNPLNFRLMQANRAFHERNIQLVPLAATNYDGEAEFFLVEAEYSQLDPRRGMSSLHRREGECAPATVVRVRTTRLDSFLADKCPPGCPLALWIDAEGAAYEVIEGLSGVIAQVQLLHVEVETSPCIGARQRLYPEVKSLLAELGFTELATDHAPRHEQFNTLFIRTALPAALRLRVRVWLARARLRYLAAGAALRVLQACCPECLRRYQAMRLRTMRLRCP